MIISQLSTMPSFDWFRKDIVPSKTIITLDYPARSEWKIIQKMNEHDHQMEENSVKAGAPPSYASIKLLCEETRDTKKKAMIRVYKQIPYIGTELDGPSERSQQASSFTPQELIALKTLTQKGSTVTPCLLGYKEGQQDSSGLVPGGFITWVAWEIVPGICLGDNEGPTIFWGLERSERDEVRLAFQKVIP